jgi:hypothetical protein
MNVSANAVFHFTKSFERLLGILREEFNPRYNMEDLSSVIPELPLYQQRIPMTCFCDIPLGAIAGHSQCYGSYGIGLTKDWAEKRGLNPILYLRRASRVSKYIKDLLVGFREHMNLSRDPGFVQAFYEFTSHVKAYADDRSGRVFYNEREWRYVPTIPSDRFYARLSMEDYADETKRRPAERELDLHHRLGFEPDDIRYLIVASEGEVLRLACEIPRIKQKYSADQKTLLTTRIHSLESLNADF